MELGLSLAEAVLEGSGEVRRLLDLAGGGGRLKSMGEEVQFAGRLTWVLLVFNDSRASLVKPTSRQVPTCFAEETSQAETSGQGSNQTLFFL